MIRPFAMPPAGAGHYRLNDTRVPACLLDTVPDGVPVDGDGLVRVDIAVDGARIAEVSRAGAVPADDVPVVDLDGGMVWPCPVDVHTNLDKGHIWPRRENPDGTFDASLAAV